MIGEHESYHGAIFSRLFREAREGVCVKRFSPGFYVLNGETGLAIKYCTKRVSPWRFTFNQEHRRRLTLFEKQVASLYIAFVCGSDGIAVLRSTFIVALFPSDPTTAGWISVARRKRKMYAVSGAGGDLPNKVPDSYFADLLGP